MKRTETLSASKKLLLLLAAILAIVLIQRFWVEEESGPAQLTASFNHFRHKDWVTGTGRVVKVLSDDLVPPRHQRFLLVDAQGKSLLIANNIDEWCRLENVQTGDVVSFRGEYVENDRGGLVHWTHPDKFGHRPSGWIKRIQEEK